MHRHLRSAGAVVCLTLLLAGCGKPQDPSTPQAPATSGAPGQGAEQQPGPPDRPDPTSAPTDLPTGQEFTLDQAARFDDGVLIEVATIKKAMATSQQRGAEETQGQLVVAEILVTNKSDKPLDTATISVRGYYNDVGAPKVVDAGKQLGDSFSGIIAPGAQAKATMGWAMPHDQLQKVTIMIDGGTPEHGEVQFSGPVG